MASDEHYVPLTLLDPDGGWINAPVHVSQLRGRPVLLHFWAMDCRSCIDQMAEVQEWIRAYGPRGLVVIGVDVTHSESELRDTNRVESFAREHGLRYPIAVDDGSMAQAYGVEQHPAYLIFDTQGILRLHAATPEQRGDMRMLLERLTGPDASSGAFAP
ncbi:peroxiredoxin family protein [Hyalangium rubrum]|uniref:TlpA disulfide reductase family protein n=1 Tax=Hyalangium rubrum TaxID=3103134 RepID=A0ABU5H748_9BACT|nr:TlpA disulfide reductase family protein [Hyalangium sp. s54d21]MDY7229295.1 TlpA disulfide reductase family protein [Hyalangium sp. s54d21]